jgi:hypothetical protein
MVRKATEGEEDKAAPKRSDEKHFHQQIVHFIFAY